MIRSKTIFVMLLTSLSADFAWTVPVRLELFPNDREIRFVGRQTEHDQIRVSSAQNVVRVRVMAWVS